MTKTVWVTGVSGFSGRYCVSVLRSRRPHYRVVGIDSVEPADLDLDAFVKLDLRSHQQLAEVVESDPPDLVMHLAGLMPPHSKAEMWAVNVAGSVSLMSAVAQSPRPNRRVLSVGSASQFDVNQSMPIRNDGDDHPGSDYGTTKLLQETLMGEIAQMASIDFMSVRTFNLIGPGVSKVLVPGALCQQFLDPDIREVVVGNTASKRDFLDIRDAANAYVLVLEDGRNGERYNVCSGIAVSIRELIDTFSEVSGKYPRLVSDENLDRGRGVDCIYGDNSVLRNELGWNQVYTLRKSVRDMLTSGL